MFYIGVGKLVIRFIWDEETAGSSPVTYTIIGMCYFEYGVCSSVVEWMLVAHQVASPILVRHPSRKMGG